MENQIRGELQPTSEGQTGDTLGTRRVEVHDISMPDDNINYTDSWMNHSHLIAQDLMHSSYYESVPQHPQQSEFDTSRLRMVPFKDMMQEASQVNPEPISTNLSLPMMQLNATSMGLPEVGQNPPIIGNNVTHRNWDIDTRMQHVDQEQLVGNNFCPDLNHNVGYFTSLLWDNEDLNQSSLGFDNHGNVGSTMIGPDSLSVLQNLNVGNLDENLNGYNNEHNSLNVDPSLDVGNIAHYLHNYSNNQHSLSTPFGSGSHVYSGVSHSEFMMPIRVPGNCTQWLNNMSFLPLHQTNQDFNEPLFSLSSGITAHANMTNQNSTELITSYVGHPSSMGLSTRAHPIASVPTRPNQTARRRQNQPQRSRNKRQVERGESSSRARGLNSQVTADGEHREQRSRIRRVSVTGESSRGAAPRPRESMYALYDPALRGENEPVDPFLRIFNSPTFDYWRNHHNGDAPPPQ